MKFEGPEIHYWKMRDRKMQDWKMQELENAGPRIQIMSSTSIYTGLTDTSSRPQYIV